MFFIEIFEIISDAKNPHKTFFKSIARAIRLIKYIADEPSWTLWYPCDLKASVLGKIASLRTKPDYIHRCICGKQKEQICMAKFDAS